MGYKPQRGWKGEIIIKTTHTIGPLKRQSKRKGKGKARARQNKASALAAAWRRMGRSLNPRVFTGAYPYPVVSPFAGQPLPWMHGERRVSFVHTRVQPVAFLLFFGRKKDAIVCIQSTRASTINIFPKNKTKKKNKCSSTSKPTFL